MSVSTTSQPSSPYDICLYFGNWDVYARNYFIANIPIQYTPTIAYAFFNIQQNASGYYVPTISDAWADDQQRFTVTGVPPLDSWNPPTLPFYGNFHQIQNLKAAGNRFRVLLAVGGWSYSANWSTVASTSATRSAFIMELINLMTTYSIFDGLTIDWEYPSSDNVDHGLAGNTVSPSDTANFVLLLHDIRAAFNAAGHTNWLITAAMSADPALINTYPVAQICSYLDQLHCMTYDFSSSAWGACPAGHHTNLYMSNTTPSYTPFSVDTSIQAYLNKGAPANKLYLGVAFYSRGFLGATALGGASNGVVPDMSWEAGVCDFCSLPRTGAVEMWDDVCKAHYSLDTTQKIINSYDTPQSVIYKCNYVKKYGLGGVIVWEISGDFPVTNSRSLVKTLYENLILNPNIMVTPTNTNGVIVPLSGSTPAPQPTSPTGPSQPTSPTGPSQPTSPTGPSQPTQPTSPTGTSQPTQPTSPTGPSQPTQPTSPTGPSQPTQPSSGIPQWSATAVYAVPGTQVIYQGNIYENKWWTQGDVPTASGPYGVWKLDGPAPTSPTGPAPTPVPTPTPTPTPAPPSTTTQKTNITNAITAINSQLQIITTNAAALSSTASSQIQTAVTQIQTALSQITTTLTTA